MVKSGWYSGFTPTDHKFTFWIADAVTDSDIDPNQSGYSRDSPYLADYEKWYAVVMGIKVNASSGAHYLWVNGIKLSEYDPDNTCGASPSITYIGSNGTIDQPGYDAPAHYRQFDAVLLTDSWADVQSGGYLSDPEDSNDNISIPGNLTGTIQ